MKKSFFATLIASVLLPGSALFAQSLPKAQGQGQSIGRKESVHLRKLKELPGDGMELSRALPRPSKATQDRMIETILTTPYDGAVTVRLTDGKKLTGSVVSLSKQGFELAVAKGSLNPYTEFKGDGGPRKISFDQLVSAKRAPIIKAAGRAFVGWIVMGAALPLTFLAFFAAE